MTTRNYTMVLLAVGLIFHSSILTAQKWPVYADHGMVVSTHRLASEIGSGILLQGGNAVDAAVATGFALAVVNPGAGNLGGGGFMVIRMADGTALTIDYREKAPMSAHERLYVDENGDYIPGAGHEGYLAVGVPGTVAGLTLALEKYGTLPLARVIQPAIELAENGFPLSHTLAREFKVLRSDFDLYPASAKKFSREDGTPHKAGELWQQPDLAASLKRIAEQGRDGFYKGETAAIMENVMKANGGLITRKDMAAYRAVIREPIVNQYREYTIYSMAPPSSGGITLSLMLNILEGYDLSRMGHNSAQYIHVLAEAMRRAYSQRARYLGDPDFNPDMPVEELISRPYADEMRRSIDPVRASTSDPHNFEWPFESEETTHYSVVDAAGNAVSTTTTLEYYYGSRIVLDGAGFLLNNEMGDFNPVPGETTARGRIGTSPNIIRPQQRMLSSMTPTIVARDGKNFLLSGSPGGRTIINTVLQTILNVVDFEMNVFEAINAPRLHHQWLPDTLRLEKWATSKDSERWLEVMGHKIEHRRSMGRAMAILIDPQTGVRSGASDPRSPDGAAVGY